jgi:peptidoglycan-N-acetylglucosamine deacetylase
MYLHYTNPFIQRLFPHFTWQISPSSKVIYLTFDDGPIPDVTPWVLVELAKYKAKATFFCVGDNIRKNPFIFEEIIAEGHAIGNHTFSHLNGWQTEDFRYLENVRLCQNYMKENQEQTKKLFRPPYGRLSSGQSKLLRHEYEIVMWSVLSGDFDTKLTQEICLKKTIQHTKAGAIVVFHDSLKAQKKLYYVLPKYLAYFANQGFSFAKLTPKP